MPAMSELANPHGGNRVRRAAALARRPSVVLRLGPTGGHHCRSGGTTRSCSKRPTFNCCGDGLPLTPIKPANYLYERRHAMPDNSSGDQPRLADVSQHRHLPEHKLLNSLIGKWMTTGETIPADGAP